MKEKGKLIESPEQTPRWRDLPLGAWFFYDSPDCVNRYSVQERTDGGCSIVCSTPYHYPQAKLNMEEIAKRHNADLSEAESPRQPSTDSWPKDLTICPKCKRDTLSSRHELDWFGEIVCLREVGQHPVPAPKDWDIILEIANLLERHLEMGCCAEENCGCPGSQLSELLQKLNAEFSGQPKPVEGEHPEPAKGGTE